jgi:cytosine/uracil/thiamine/allantoin permease
MEVEVVPVKYARTTNSMRKGVHFRAMVTLGCGVAMTWLGMMCCVLLNHQEDVRLSTWPL